MADATAAVLCGSLPDGLPARDVRLAGQLRGRGRRAGRARRGRQRPAARGEQAARPSSSRAMRPVTPARFAGGATGDAAGGDPAAVTVPGSGTLAADCAAALVAGGAGAVAILSDGGVRAVTAAGEWRAELAGRAPAPGVP